MAMMLEVKVPDENSSILDFPDVEEPKDADWKNSGFIPWVEMDDQDRIIRAYGTIRDNMRIQEEPIHEKVKEDLLTYVLPKDQTSQIIPLMFGGNRKHPSNAFPENHPINEGDGRMEMLRSIFLENPKNYVSFEYRFSYFADEKLPSHFTSRWDCYDENGHLQHSYTDDGFKHKEYDFTNSP
uniref:Uncharacterized protein n=1 Tax=Panagrolaimus davidi TaxID=227884 RepID=A0A914PG13_9BILA